MKGYTVKTSTYKPKRWKWIAVRILIGISPDGEVITAIDILAKARTRTAIERRIRDGFGVKETLETESSLIVIALSPKE